MNEVSTRTIEVITSEIKSLEQHSLECFIEIGRRLVEAKELIDHGEWGGWLEDNFDFSQRTANNMMKLFEEYGSAQSALFGAEVASETFKRLSVSKCLALLAVPAEEREQFAEDVGAENMSSRELEAAIKAKADAEKHAAEVAKNLAQEKERTAAVQKELDSAKLAISDAEKNRRDAMDAKSEAEKKIRELSDKLTDIQSQPIECTATVADSAEVDKAVAEAVEAARAEAEKEAAELQKKLEAADKEREEAIKAKADAEGKIAELTQKIEAEKKAEAMASPEVTEFKTLFEQVQGMMQRMVEIIPEAGDKAQNLKAAFNGLLDKFCEAVA